MSTLQVVRQTIQRYNLIRPGECVVVGVSGGPDSLCLLHVLRELAAELRLSLHVAHLHHGLRGAEADADAEFVQQTAEAWDLPCTIERANVAALARKPGISVEEAARNVRYAFLGRLAQQLGAHTIAVGHNADDQSETVLMHWLRGSGLAGLRGMTPSTRLVEYRLGAQMSTAAGGRELQGASSGRLAGEGWPRSPRVGGDETSTTPDAIRIIRPLLFVPRTEIERYCQTHGLAPRFDRSNEDTTYFRNRLRHELLPLLEGYNPQIRRVLRHTATVLADDFELLRSQLQARWREVLLEETTERLVFDLARWRALPRSLQRGVIRAAISYLRRSLRNIDFVHVENALWILREGNAGARVTLASGLEVVLGYSRFAVGDEGVELPPGDLPQLAGERLLLTMPGVTVLEGSGWQAVARLLDVAALPAGWQENDDPWQAWLDAGVVGQRPWLRTRQAGDRFQPLGMAGRRKLLGEFFTNDKVPAAARAAWPLLVTTAGEIAWVCGLRLDERARVSDATMRVLYVRLERTSWPQ